MSDSEKSGTPPSAPVPPDPPHEPVDEFAHIPDRRARAPVIAIAGIVLALFLAFKLRHDVRYALSSGTPVEIPDARVLATRPLADLPIDRYVRLAGRPERGSAVVLDSQGSWKFRQLFRLRGTGGRVFVRRQPDPLPIAAASSDVFTGRLVRFHDLSFGASIAQHFGSKVSATHFFAPTALHARVAAGGTLQLTDRGGEDVRLGGADQLIFDVAQPEHYRIEIAPDRRPDVARVRTLLEQNGGTVSKADEAADHSTTILARVPAATAARALAAVGDLGRGIRLRPARETIEAKASDLAAEAQALRVAGRTLPLDQILNVRTRATVAVPADAVLLLEGEAPRGELKSLVILAFLAAFAAVNLLGLRKVK